MSHSDTRLADTAFPPFWQAEPWHECRFRTLFKFVCESNVSMLIEMLFVETTANPGLPRVVSDRLCSEGRRLSRLAPAASRRTDRPAIRIDPGQSKVSLSLACKMSYCIGASPWSPKILYQGCQDASCLRHPERLCVCHPCGCNNVPPPIPEIPLCGSQSRRQSR